METENSNIGQKGRFYLTKNIWVPQEPIENFNLKMSDMILRRMPKLPLAGDEAILRLANILRSAVDEAGDTGALLGHIGGDDFVLILEKIEEPALRRMLADLVQRFRLDAESLYSAEARAAGW